MTELADGYVKGIDYTYDCYRELNPLHARLALLNAGFAPPSATGAACELGFGFGVSANLHAAASGSVWWGCDFNPTQARFAQELAQASGARAELFDASFADFCQRDDLPEFDFIGLHGIWSWVSNANRLLIVDFVRRRLRLGGVLYVSYNTYPGLAQMVPVRELMLEHAEQACAGGAGIVEQMDGAIAWLNELLAATPGYAAMNPVAAARIQEFKQQNRSYLAHEYFNRDWMPMLHSEFCRWMQAATLDYAGSALYSDHVDALNLVPTQVDFLGRMADPALARSAHDFLVNRQFRKDYWVKGARRLNPTERAQALRRQRVVLISPADKVVLRAGGSLVDQDLVVAIYRPLVALLANHQIRTLGELETDLVGHGVSFDQLLDAVLVLIGKGDMANAQEPGQIEGALQTSAQLNQHLIEGSVHGSRISNLASPVTGGGIYVQPFHQQMLLARSRGLESSAQWAGFLWDHLRANAGGLVKPGGGFMSELEGLAALTQESLVFADGHLRVLQSLKVV